MNRRVRTSLARLIGALTMIVAFQCADDGGNRILSLSQIESWVTYRDHTALTNITIPVSETGRSVDGRDDIGIRITYEVDLDAASVTNDSFDILGVNESGTTITVPDKTVSLVGTRDVQITFASDLPTPGVYRMRIRNIRSSTGVALAEHVNERILVRLQADLDFNGKSLEAADTSAFTTLLVGSAFATASAAAALADAEYSGQVTAGDIGPFSSAGTFDLSQVTPPNF